jgi:cation transport regulator ChaB
MPGKKELPATLKRSSKSAREMWVKVHDNAVDEYGEGGRAHRTAWAALKHDYEKKGDRWVAKSRRKAKQD